MDKRVVVTSKRLARALELREEFRAGVQTIERLFDSMKNARQAHELLGTVQAGCSFTFVAALVRDLIPSLATTINVEQTLLAQVEAELLKAIEGMSEREHASFRQLAPESVDLRIVRAASIGASNTGAVLHALVDVILTGNRRDQLARDAAQSREKTAEHLALIGATNLLLIGVSRDISHLSSAEAAQLTEAVQALELVATHLLQGDRSKHQG